MADINPFLGDNYHELHAMRGSSIIQSEQAASNSAIEVVGSQLDEAQYPSSSSKADLGLKSVIDEDVNTPHANYKRALQHFPVKNARVAAGRVADSLPVFDPEYLKDDHYGHSSASRTDALTVGSYTAQLGSNQVSTSDEEEHIREDTSLYVSDDRADEDQANEKFRLCFVAPKSISDCMAFVKYEGLLGEPIAVELHLEPTLDFFGFPYNFWFSDALPRREERNTGLAYHFTIIDIPASAGFVTNTISSILNNFGGAKQDSERVGISTIKELRKCLSFRFDVLNERGEVLKSDSLGVIQWLAMMTQMIFVVNPSNIGECVREFLRVRHGHKLKEYMLRGYYYSHGKPLLGTVANWAAKVADVYGGSKMPDAAHKKTVGLKMFILCLGLFELLKELARYEEGQVAMEKLYEVYEVVLCALHKFSISGCDYTPPPFSNKILQEGVSELVGRISRFSFDWISQLQILGRYDNTFSFLEKVAEFQLDMRDVSRRKNAEQVYRSSVNNMLNTKESFGKAKALRKRTFRKVLFAAPTFPTFLIQSRELQAWMRGAADWDPTENIDDEIRAELQDTLYQWFTKVMPDMRHQSSRRKAEFWQQHLELIVAQVECEAVFENSVVLPGFLSSSFREHIVEMLLQIMSKPASEFGRKSEPDLVSLVDITEKIVFKYPFTFLLPLLTAECQLLLRFASSDFEEFSNLSKVIIQKVGNCYSDETLKAEHVEHLSKDVLRPWLSSSVGRGKQPQSPLSYFRCVQDIFNLGVDPSSFFGKCLTQAAVASSQQRSRGLQHFLAESEKISQLHESLQLEYKSAVVTMIHWQLQSANNVAELDRISEQILRALCGQIQHGHGALSAKEKIQVELCVALLNKMAENTVFVKSLTEQAFQTISTSNFASCLLQIQVAPPPIKEHWIYLKVEEACHAFGTLVVQGEVTMGIIESVSRTDKWGSILKSLGYKAASVALEGACKELVLYKRRMQACDILATLCGYLGGKGYPIQGIHKWSALVTSRKEKWRSTRLFLIVASHWPEEAHPSLFDHLDSLVLLHESEIFRCILLNLCRNLFERLRVEGKMLPLLLDYDAGSSSIATPDASFAMVAGDLVPRAVNRYRTEMEPYCGKKNLEKMNMDKLHSLWVTVDARQIEREFDLARRELKMKDTKSSTWFPWGKAVDMIELIQAWKAIKAKGELVAALPKVAQLFQFDESCEGYLGKMMNLMQECDENCSLKEFTDLHKKEGKNLLAKVSVNEEFAFIQLAKSEALINFLRDKLDEDFRNLIDAVEEGSDNDFVQESILSDLIDLHRMFRPVLKSRCPTFEQLWKVMLTELKTSAASESASASTLAAKLFMCDENVAQITKFLSSVANRGLKMKDHMKRILRGGKYHFTLTDTLCDLKLTCGDKGVHYVEPIFSSEVSSRDEICVYNLAELQDLRSRARLVLSTHKAQSKRFLTDKAGLFPNRR